MLGFSSGSVVLSSNTIARAGRAGARSALRSGTYASPSSPTRAAQPSTCTGRARPRCPCPACRRVVPSLPRLFFATQLLERQRCGVHRTGAAAVEFAQLGRQRDAVRADHRARQERDGALVIAAGGARSARRCAGPSTPALRGGQRPDRFRTVPSRRPRPGYSPRAGARRRRRSAVPGGIRSRPADLRSSNRPSAIVNAPADLGSPPGSYQPFGRGVLVPGTPHGAPVFPCSRSATASPARSAPLVVPFLARSALLAGGGVHRRCGLFSGRRRSAPLSRPGSPAGISAFNRSTPTREQRARRIVLGLVLLTFGCNGPPGGTFIAGASRQPKSV